MTRAGLFWIAMTALAAAGSNVSMREGVLRAGGFGVSGRGLEADLWHLLAQPLFLAGLIVYGLAALFWFRVVSTENLATSYVLLIGLSCLLVTCASFILFGERLAPAQVAGVLLVLVGMLCIVEG